ncbi:MAG: aldehyde ferredoxin oxidoreductase family protein [Asgard group archaeon]|nr:aldehyde ferredoxin oxidoreductase family protein [Asgard group archaeon]
MSGFRGKILRVNLSTNKITKEDLDLHIGNSFLGGSGLAAYYYWQKIKNLESIPEPLSPENDLYFMNGILTGLPSYCTPRSNFCARSPLTGIWGESNIGGKIGPYLKFANFDGLIIEGKADQPVFLEINNDDVRIRNANDFWGLGTYETLEKINTVLKYEKSEIVCIGPAGENQVKFANIMTVGGRAAGRTGMGAVMGSKKLKAITIFGKNREFNLPDEYDHLSKAAYDAVREDYAVEIFSEFGTAGYVDVALEYFGDMPIKNWSKGTLDNGSKISGTTMFETILIGKSTCYRCPIACGREIEIKKGKYKLKNDGPEFETLASFGSNLQITNLEAIAYANYLANDLGLDTISAGAIIGVFFDLVEKNIIPKSDLPRNINCKFGDADSLLELLKLISKRQNIGNILAEGSKILAEKYNKIELAPQVAGLEAPFHDPRAFSGLAVMYVTSPRGACHLNGDAYFAQQGANFPEVGVSDFPSSRFDNEGVVKPLVKLQSYRQLFNAIGLCQFFNTPANILAKQLSIAMNETVTLSDLILFGDRLFALKRLINLKLGWTPSLEFLPKVMLQKLDGPTGGHVPDVQLQLAEWYKIRNYDRKTGKPSKEELKRLGLVDLL